MLRLSAQWARADTSKPLADDPGTGHASGVVVLHPGVQHSRELARALFEGGILAGFITSSTGALSEAAWLPSSLRSRFQLRVVKGVPPDKLESLPYLEAAAWIMATLCGNRLGQRASYFALDLFDRLVAARALARRPRIVVGFENSCRRTFSRAKAEGVLCVLDAASVHHSAQPDDDREMDPDFKRGVNARKDEEIRLADRIVVLSKYARSTYVAAGVPDEKISIVAPGISLAGDSLAGARRPKSADGIRFLFAGNVKFGKGIDLLLSAFSRLDVVGKQLTIAGALARSDALPDPLPPGVSYLGKLDRVALAEAYARSDMLVLPSRADGFGLVVGEAMSAGLPVIVSTAVGAKDFVTPGETGWIFESGNADSLMQAMSEACARRGGWAAMGERARQAVADLTWRRYGERIRDLYRGLLQR